MLNQYNSNFATQHFIVELQLHVYCEHGEHCQSPERDASVDISASGNLALAKTEDLAFDISGYVYKVNVEVGDQVKKGDGCADRSV